MLKILIYSYNYYPEPIGIAPLMTELAQGLVARGHRVRVVTGMPNYPERQIYPAYRGKFYCTEILQGVQVQRSYIMIRPNPGLLARMLLDGSFVVTSILHALKGWRPDVILYTSPPLPVSVPAVILGRIWRVPVVLNLQDILPEAAIHVGLLRNRFAIQVFEALERFAYRQATGISVITKKFADNLVQKGIETSKIVCIPNWVDVNFIRPLPIAENLFRQTYGLDDRFVVLYAGNIALTQGLETVIEAAYQLQHLPNLAVVVVGETKALQRLQQYCQKRQSQALAASQALADRQRSERDLSDRVVSHDGQEARKSHLGLAGDEPAHRNPLDTDAPSTAEARVGNLHFLPFQPREQLPVMLAAADVGLIVQRRNVVSFNMPSKTQLLLASGRPIIASVPATGSAAQVVAQSQGGLVVEPENATALAEAITALYHDRAYGQRLGHQGRQFALKHYSFEQALQSYEALFERLIKGEPIADPRIEAPPQSSAANGS